MTDPREIIAKSPMPWAQVLVVILTIGLNALDGFDIASISFAAPGITAEWGISRATLGFVLSMELVGMGLGSVILGGFADKLGRRPTILASLVVMVIGMYGATLSTSVYDLSLWRIFTGIGIGGMLAATNAVAAEFSNDKRRQLFISLMVIGYPIGIVFGGTFVRPLLAEYDWRYVFYFGTALTFLFIPLVYFCIPESLSWLARKQPAGALEKINTTLARFKHGPIQELPVITEIERKRSMSDLFSPGLLSITVLVTLAYSFHIMTFYFIIKWVPQIVADMGFDPASAGTVLTLSNVGGAIGGFLFGLFAARVGLKLLTIAILLLSVITIIIFGYSPQDLTSLSLLAAIAGFCTNAGVVGIYNILAHSFPTHVRASGTGVAIGVGRAGAWISPIIAGFLFEAQLDLGKVAIVMAMGSLLAAIAVTFIKLQPKTAD
jgi:benzoate transport